MVLRTTTKDEDFGGVVHAVVYFRRSDPVCNSGTVVPNWFHEQHPQGRARPCLPGDAAGSQTANRSLNAHLIHMMETRPPNPLAAGRCALFAKKWTDSE